MNEPIARRTTEHLSCLLTDAEIRQYGADLAVTVQDVASETDRQADIRAQLKARMAELEARQSQLAIKISRGEEFRDVEVLVWINYDAGVETRTRVDTGEEIASRPLREDERQGGLPGIDDAE